MSVCLCVRPAWFPAPPGCGFSAGVCAWAWVAAAPRHSWLGCWRLCVFLCVPRLYPALPGWGVRCGRVSWGSGSGCARHCWLGSWGVCPFVRVLRFYPAIPGGVVCVCVDLGFVCPPAWMLWRVAPCVRRVRFPSPSWGAACGVGVCRSCCGGSLSPPLQFCVVFSLGCGGHVWFLALSCPGLVVSVAGCPCLWSRGLRPPFPSRSGCAFVFFVFLPVSARAWCGLACAGCPSLCWAAALGRVSLVLAWWSSGVPSGGPMGAAFGAVWLRGLPASCGVGGRPRGCGAMSCPPLFLWGGSACSSLCLPWAGARTGRHSVWLTGLLLVLAFCWALPWPDGFGGLRTRLTRWPLLSG